MGGDGGESECNQNTPHKILTQLILKMRKKGAKH